MNQAITDALSVWALSIRVRLLFFTSNNEHQCHRMIDVLNTAVGTGMVVVGGNCIDAEALIDCVDIFRANGSILSENAATGYLQRGT